MKPETPRDWAVERLDAIAEVILSNVNKKSSPEDVPVRLCNYMDVYSNSRITSDLPFMEATATAAQVEKFALQVGDVVITKDSEDPSDIAVPSVVVDDFNGSVVCGYHLAILRPDGVDGPYLSWALRSRPVSDQFTRRANGTTRFGLTKDVIQSAWIPVPNSREQRKIAAILSSVDDAIAATRKVIEQTKRVKQGLLQTLMTRGIGHTRFKKTEIGEIPETWEVRTVESVSDVAYGVTVNQARRHSTDRVPLLTVAAHDPDDGWRTEGISEIGAVEGDREKYAAQPGDVLVVEGNGNPDILGRPLIWDGRIPGVLHQNHLIRARPTSVESEWIALALSSPSVWKQIRAQAKSSSGLYTINSRVVKTTRLPVAPPDERRQIIAAFRSHDNLVAGNSAAQTRLVRLKRGLMQDLLTGRVRVQPD